MKLSRGHIVGLVLVVASAALAVALYNRLPDPVPTHWNLRSEPDGFTQKPWGAFTAPLVLGGVWLVLFVLQRIAPRGFTLDRFERVWDVLQLAILGFLFVVTTLATLAAAGAPVPLGRAIPGALGLLLMILGNFLGKVTRNFFVGIRTPWTIASEEVWLRTHRLGGKLFVIAGLSVLVCAVLGLGGFFPTIFGVLAASVIAVLYSYIIYRRLEGFPPSSSGQSSPGL